MPPQGQVIRVNMGLLLLVAFIGVPLIEIGLFIQVGGLIGMWPTILVVILTAVTGASLLRHQGLGTLARLQESLDRGEPPLDPVFDGFCLLAAGILLLTPGFFTDALGFLLFTPPFRTVLKRFVASRIKVDTHATTTTANNERVIDGDYQDVTDTKNQNHPDHGANGRS